jgi:hypothetical protein
MIPGEREIGNARFELLSSWKRALACTQQLRSLPA